MTRLPLPALAALVAPVHPEDGGAALSRYR